jgi:hypothetical protein
MTDAPTTPAPSPPCPSAEAHWSQAFALRQLHMLGELAELGLDVARAVERQASDPAAPQVVHGDVALAYARVSRAVRLALMMQSRLIDELKAAERAGARAQANAQANAQAAALAEAEIARDAADPADAPFTPGDQRRARLLRIVERVVETEHPDDEETLQILMTDVCERLDDETLYGDLLERPASELVARLCKDLGLDPDWAELAQERWALREVESGDIGWPLAGLTPMRPPPLAGEGDPEGVERAFGADTG